MNDLEVEVENLDSLSSLVYYQCPPEETVVEFLRYNIPLAGLSARKIECPITLGHPLFTDEVVQNPKGDRNFPRIGVEWTRDTRIDSMGQNYSGVFTPNKNFHEILAEIQQTPQHLRFATDEMLQNLTQATKLEQFVHMVKSEVIIAGFASGGLGRKVSSLIYQAVDASLSGVMHDISQAVGVSVLAGEMHETNIFSDQYGFPIWGFEIPITIVQMRAIIRVKPEYRFSDIRKVDIFFKNSRTKFKGNMGFSNG